MSGPEGSEAARASSVTISWITTSALALKARSRDWTTSITTAVDPPASTFPATETCSVTSAMTCADSAIREVRAERDGLVPSPSSASERSSRMQCRSPATGESVPLRSARCFPITATQSPSIKQRKTNGDCRSPRSIAQPARTSVSCAATWQPTWRRCSSSAASRTSG